MRHVDTGRPLLPERIAPAEEEVGIAVRKRRGRLVEDEDRRVLRQGTDDLDDLPQANPELGDPLRDVDLVPEPEALNVLAGDRLQLRLIDQPEAPWLPSEQQVLR